MRVLKEAYTDHVKAVVAPDYVTIEHMPVAHGQEPIHLSRQEACELVDWLSHELSRVLPEIIPLPKQELFGYSGEYSKKDPVAVEHNKKIAQVVKKSEPECAYDPGPRTATQTVELKIGDPNLAYRMMSGRSGAPGDGDAGITDLAALGASVTKL